MHTSTPHISTVPIYLEVPKCVTLYHASVPLHRLLPLPGMSFCTQMAPTRSLRPHLSPPLGRLSYVHAYHTVSMVDSFISLPDDSSQPVMVIPFSWRSLVWKWVCEPTLRMKNEGKSRQGESGRGGNSDKGFLLLRRTYWTDTDFLLTLYVKETPGILAAILWCWRQMVWGGALANWEEQCRERKWTWLLNPGIIPDSGLGVVLDNKSLYYLNQCLLEFLAANVMLTDAAVTISWVSLSSQSIITPKSGTRHKTLTELQRHPGGPQ